jgi:hypothetical protein
MMGIHEDHGQIYDNARKQKARVAEEAYLKIT